MRSAPSRSGSVSAASVRFRLLALLLLPLVVPAPPSAARQLAPGWLYPNLARRLASAAPAEAIETIVVAEPGRENEALRGVQGLLGVVPRRVMPSIGAFSCAIPAGRIGWVARLPGVRRLELDAPVSVCLDGPTGTFGIDAARQSFGADGDADGSPATYSADDVVIAIVDTGIDVRHPDLSGKKVIGWYDAVNKRAAPYDDHYHGTHVASIAAGTGRGDPAYRGVAPGAALVGVKVLDWLGQGSTSDIVNGIEWCIDNRARLGIRVMNISLGTSDASDGTDALCQAVNAANRAGIVCCVAAGNAGPSSPTDSRKPEVTVASPAAARGAITVGAMADLRAVFGFEDGGPPIGQRILTGGVYLAPFSSRGPTLDGRTKPDVCAPGVNIVAARANARKRRLYVPLSGTSMAAPFVAGTVALMLDLNPALSPDDVREILTSTAEDWGPPGWDTETGAGRLDGFRAVAAAAAQPAATTRPGQPHFVAGGHIEPGPGFAYDLEVVNPAWPVCMTTVSPPPARGGRGGNIDLEVRDPAGRVLAAAAGLGRQETLTWQPAAAGRYRLLVQARGDGADYWLDVAGGIAGLPAAVALKPLGPAAQAGAGARLQLAPDRRPAAGRPAVTPGVDSHDRTRIPGAPGLDFWPSPSPRPHGRATQSAR